MTPGEQQIFNLMIEFFEEDEWDFQWMEGMSILNMGYSGRNGKWICYAQARELQQQFVFYSVLPFNVPVAKRAAIAEFITRVNYGMILGNFELDFDDGEVRYKTSIDVEGSELTPSLIRQLVYANIIITDRYLPGLMRVMYGDISAIQALEEIELNDEMDDIEDYVDMEFYDDDDEDDAEFDDFDEYGDGEFDEDDYEDDEEDPFGYLDDGYDDDDDENDSEGDDFNPLDDDDDPSTNGKHPS